MKSRDLPGPTPIRLGMLAVFTISLYELWNRGLEAFAILLVVASIALLVRRAISS